MHEKNARPAATRLRRYAPRSYGSLREDSSPLNISRGATKSQRTRVPTPATRQRAATLRPVEGALVTALASCASVGVRLACGLTTALTAAADQSTLMAEKILKTNQ